MLHCGAQTQTFVVVINSFQKLGKHCSLPRNQMPSQEHTKHRSICIWNCSVHMKLTSFYVEIIFYTVFAKSELPYLTIIHAAKFSISKTNEWVSSNKLSSATCSSQLQLAPL